MTAAERRIDALRRGIARRRKELDSCGKRLAKNTEKYRRALGVRDFVEAAEAEEVAESPVVCSVSRCPCLWVEIGGREWMEIFL